MIESTPQIVESFHSILSDYTAGDSMRKDVKWTNLSRRQIARNLEALGAPAGKKIVSRLLYANGCRRRKPQKKRTMGRHANRSAQFENITHLKKEYLDTGRPVISIDTKKKELLGQFYRDGVVDSVNSINVNDHNFPSCSDGEVIPRGIYEFDYPHQSELLILCDGGGSNSALAYT